MSEETHIYAVGDENLCTACHFFKPGYLPRDGESILDAAKRCIELEGETAGHCYRYPPIMISDDPIIWSRPSVDLLDWCGEFKARK